jgi:hypothetical protein
LAGCGPPQDRLQGAGSEIKEIGEFIAGMSSSQGLRGNWGTRRDANASHPMAQRTARADFNFVK